MTPWSEAPPGSRPPLHSHPVWFGSFQSIPHLWSVILSPALNPSAVVRCSQTKLPTFRLQQQTWCYLSLPVPTCPALSWPCAHAVSQSRLPLQLLKSVLASVWPRASVALGAPPLPFCSCSSRMSTCFTNVSSIGNSPRSFLSSPRFPPLTSSGHTRIYHVGVGQSRWNRWILALQPNTNCSRFLGLW